MRQSLFISDLQEHVAVFQRLAHCQSEIEQAGRWIAEALRSGGKVMFCGNGGSAADSQHLAAELVGRFVRDRRPLAGLALSTDTSGLTCIGNDYGFDQIFERQVIALGRPGDILVALSTSGNSVNVQRAVGAARHQAIRTIGLLGRDGGTLRGEVDLPLVVPSHSTARIQEAHIFIGHTLCAMIELELGFASAAQS